MNTVKVIEKSDGTRETTYQPEQTRIRINYSIGAKGQFQTDITSEAETIETAMKNLNEAHAALEAFRIANQYKKAE